MSLELQNVTKSFSSTSLNAVNDISLSLKQGEILGLLGPSGCGKTTLLRIIAGFEKPSSGTVKIGETIVANSTTWLPPELRNTGMVFQDYALFPHLTVGENVAFGLKRKKEVFGKKQLAEKVSAMLNLVGLAGLEKRYPHQLSGGQQQRVALARAIAPQPAIILLDEPLSNLDVQVRLRLRDEIRHILKATNTSAIFVTHDQEECLAIADNIAVMCQGRLEQLGTPEEIYTKPSSRFVAEFVTQANFLPTTRDGDFWKTEIGIWKIPTPKTLESQSSGELMLRQEDIILQLDDTSLVVILDRQFLGREYHYCLQTPSGRQLHARTTLNTQLEIGSKVKLSVSDEAIQIF